MWNGDRIQHLENKKLKVLILNHYPPTHPSRQENTAELNHHPVLYNLP
jgi:hypothetical protein